MALLALAWAAALTITLEAWAPLRVLSGLLLVMVLPGAFATYAFLGPKSGVDWRLRAVLAIAMSLVIALAVGLILALVSDRISPVAAAVSLAFVVTACAFVASARTDASTALAWRRVRRPQAAVMAVSGALLVLAVALVVAALGVESLPTKFTAISLTRDGDRARLVIENEEGVARSYDYEVRTDRRPLGAGNVTVDSGSRREVTVSLTGESSRVDATVSVDDGDRTLTTSLQMSAGEEADPADRSVSAPSP